MNVHETTIRIRLGLLKRTYGIRFDMLAFFRMLEEFGITLGDDITKVSEQPFDEVLSVAIYTGGESYCFKHNKKVWFTKEDVLRWVDDSRITRGHLKEISKLWLAFMREFETDKKKQKGGKP